MGKPKLENGRMTITASLMLPDTLKSPLMTQKVTLTKEDLKKGIEHIHVKVQKQIIKRLEVVIPEDYLNDICEEMG